jgi:hypothetical protein
LFLANNSWIMAVVNQGIGAEPQKTGFMEEGQMKRSEIRTFNINPLLACFWTSLNLIVQTMVRRAY